jgi:hypothetical protein
MQKVVAHLSTEAEYMALPEACFKIAWLTSLQKEIGYSPTTPTPVAVAPYSSLFFVFFLASAYCHSATHMVVT